MAKQVKEVKVIARYAHKTNGTLNGTVTYLVRASNGVDTYCTTLVDGKASGCSCPAKSHCYHKTQLEVKEAARPFAAKVLPVWTEALVQTGKLVAPAKTVKVSRLIEQAVKATVPTVKTTDIGNRGNLNGARGFSLMR